MEGAIVSVESGIDFDFGATNNTVRGSRISGFGGSGIELEDFMTCIDPNINRWARSLVAGLTLWIGLYGVSWASDADLVVVGPVVTMAAGKPSAARGLAVTGGKIAFVGARRLRAESGCARAAG